MQHDCDFTTDTRKDHCPIRIFYAGPNPSAGPLHTNELDQDPRWTQGRYPIAVIKATEHGDYSGSTVEASNYACLQELSVKYPHEWPLVQIYGSHGYQALAYDATLGPVPPTWELCNALDGFENHEYIFDDDHHSSLESELESEAWEEHGRSDFVKGLTALVNLLDPGYEHDLGDGPEWDDVDELWHRGCDAYNVNGGAGHKFETGSTVYFYIGEWIGRAEREPNTGRSHEAISQRTMRDDVLKLAHSTRTEQTAEVG